MDPRIQKKIVYAGTQNVTFVPGTKVVFHFKTTKCDPDKTVIDDSRTLGNPMELVLGKQFKLEVWEAIVQQMSLHEVATFTCEKSLVATYPFVSKTLREAGKPKSDKRGHRCCGMTIQSEGIGYDDLNELMKNPQSLEFTIELLQVIPPHEYEKETWQMTEDEKLKNIPVLKDKGNQFFKEKNYDAAMDTYATAISMVEQLMLSEKPHDEEWASLNNLKIPLILNYAQCKLLQKEYYTVIEHCTTVLQTDPNNVKALYRRGKAHIGAWNEKEAYKDLIKAAELDKSLRNIVSRELQTFSDAIKERNKSQSKNLANIFAK